MKRLALFVVVASVCAVSNASAQFEIQDPASIAQHDIIGAWMKKIVAVSTDIETSMRRMGRSLRIFEDFNKFVSLDQPLWRTRRVDPALPQTVAFMDAVNAGDATGAFIDQALVIRLGVDAEMDVSPEMRISRATLDMADSSLKNAIDMTGRIRGNRRAELAAMTAQIAHLILPEGSAVAALEKISGAGVIRAHQARTRMELASSRVELEMVENKRARDSENAGLRMRLRAMEVPPNMMADADAEMAQWRQP